MIRRLLYFCVISCFTWIGVDRSDAAEELYAVTDFFGGSKLIRIDTTTGAGTLVGPLDSDMFSFGLSDRGSQLYTFDQIADRIRELSTATGATLNTIDIGIGDLAGEGSIAFNDGGTGFLTASAGDTGTLYTFDIGVPDSSFVGPLTVSMDGLDFQPGTGTLFGLNQGASGLYTINPATAAVSLVGGTGLSIGPVLDGLSFRSDGALFSITSDSLYSLNPATGAASLIGSTGFNNLSGLSFLSVSNDVIPEPTTMAIWSLLGALALTLGWWRRRRDA